MRYPLLWEQISPDDPHEQDWRWSDDRVARLHARGQRLIAGLVHHGSGPRYTDLLDPGFAEGLARHADAVARRYPFIEAWTPINEPVTTARFSALYGHWYPHHRDEHSFWLALVNQIDATRLAMRAIRAVSPRARLIQTDDLGRTYATASLRDQAGFDNVRRWMGWDLLCGMVRPGHALWTRLCGFGLQARLEAIAADPCPPDVIGVNHYLTSDRFLDHRVRRYSGGVGQNATRAFVDTEAIRVLDPPPGGVAGILREAWQRYRLPIAITEVHNGCTREEQMRWMWSGWASALQARDEGVDVRAVTSWSLFGSAGWDTLLTSRGRYEPGAFDVSGGAPRPTAMVALLKSLARGERPSHPVMQGDGWWRRSIRLGHPAIARVAPLAERRRGAPAMAPSHGAQLLIAGAGGALGGALAAACRHRDLAHVALARGEMDLHDPRQVAEALDRYRPWAVIDATRGTQPAGLADACAARGIASVHVSSDSVFGGMQRACDERDVPSPVDSRGRDALAAERAIAARDGRHLIVRTAAFFSPFDPHNFAIRACDALVGGTRFAASGDGIITPTYLPDLCDAMLDLAIDGETGFWHLTNGDACSPAEFARRIAHATGLDPALIDERASGEPGGVPLVSHRGRLLPPLDSAIKRFATRWRQARPSLAQGAAAEATLCR